MIQLNLRAKPYNACEVVLGPDLFFLMTKTQLFGQGYFMKEPPKEIYKEVVCLYPHQHFKKVYDLFHKGGWDEGVPADIPGMDTYERGDHIVYVTTNKQYYEKFVMVQEVLKYLDQQAMVLGTKVVSSLNEIMTNHAKIDKDGHLVWPQEEWGAPEAPQAIAQNPHAGAVMAAGVANNLAGMAGIDAQFPNHNWGAAQAEPQQPGPAGEVQMNFEALQNWLIPNNN